MAKKLILDVLTVLYYFITGLAPTSICSRSGIGFLLVRNNHVMI